jgi:hypothetical protein
MTQSKDRIQGKRLNLGTSPKIIKLRQKSKLAVVKKIPTDLIEEKTLELLGVEIVDREDYDDLVVPHGEIRFWVYRCDELIGTISTWVIGGIDTYHPKDYSNPKQYSRFDSLFGAVCQLLPKQELDVTYRDAFQILKQRFATAPDYM